MILKKVLYCGITGCAVFIAGAFGAEQAGSWKPYSPPCVERENVFEFTEKPVVKNLGNDKYEITFAVKGNCDVAAGIVDDKGAVVRHLGSGVLGSNAPAPFQKNSMKQTLYWNGKDDLDFYCKEPEKLKVRVMLGLKPEFDKRIGGTSGNNLPGFVWGIAIGQDGAYVFVQGSATHGHLTLRKFDHDGKYLQTLTPPPANLPESKLAGLSYVEYEPGKRAVFGASLHESIVFDGGMFIKLIAGSNTVLCQPALAGERIVLCSRGAKAAYGLKVDEPPRLVYVFTDGSTDVKGVKGVPLAAGMAFVRPFMAASPDGKMIYISGAEGAQPGTNLPVVLCCPADGSAQARHFVGEPKQPGNDNQHLNNPRGIDCDAQGRIYIVDQLNNRIQVFSPEGTFLKTIPAERPEFICIHRKTGAIYVQHEARVAGKSAGRVTKLRSFDDPKEEFHVDGFSPAAMALDSWTSQPRLWLGGQTVPGKPGEADKSASTLRIFEERNGTLEKIFDFDDVARKDAGTGYFGRFRGVSSDNRGTNSPKSACDPVHEKLFYRNSLMFDLRTGTYEGQFFMTDKGYEVAYDDMAFDKKGYLHVHSWPEGGFSDRFQGRVWRLDPSRPRVKSEAGNQENGGPVVSFPEVPYDYGDKLGPDGCWEGAIPTNCQPCSHGFQHGMGVNMRGDIAVCSRIMYTPKMEDEMYELAQTGMKEKAADGMYPSEGNYMKFRGIMQNMLKTEDVYFIRREPGIPIQGDTIWIYNANGEARYKKYSAVLGGRLAGVGIDEDGFPYFATFRSRMVNGAPFLKGKGGTLGAPEDGTNRDPFTGTYIKGKPEGVRVLMKHAVVALDPAPARPPDLWAGDDNWIEGAEWLYAGDSPIISGQGSCECPSSRPWLDWYKRSYVPEAYRHSIGILDANGNLIMHLGRYGNFDSANGAKSLIPVGGDNIGMFLARYIGGTDNYLVFDDWGERLVVLKLNYQAEETVGIGGK